MSEHPDETDLTLEDLRRMFAEGEPVELVEIGPKEEAMKIEPRQVTTSLGIQLDPTATLLGVARCSEASPQCTAVQRRPNGDLVLANHEGRQLVIPAAEVMATAALMLKTTEPQP